MDRLVVVAVPLAVLYSVDTLEPRQHQLLLVLVVLDTQEKILLDQMVLILLLFSTPVSLTAKGGGAGADGDKFDLDVLVRVVDVVVALVRNHTLVAVKTKHHKTPHFK